MTANIIDGKSIAKQIRLTIQEKIGQRTKQGLRAPGLDVVLIGEDPASQIYVQKKHEACQEAGLISHIHRLPVDTTQTALLDLIDQLNHDTNIDGILVQLPLPDHIDTNLVLDKIANHKDVDGFHPHNLGLLAQRRPLLRSCTPYGIMRLLEHSGIDVCGMDATVVGVSNNVGRPMLLELLLAKATVTACHSRTKNLAHHIKNADLLIAALGKRGVIKSEWIKPGAVVIDVGITRLPNGKIAGDIEFETAKEIAGWITPVPGGVGPMTVAILLENTLFAAENLHTNY